MDFEILHDAMPDEAHTCPEYDLDSEGCYRAEPCLECGTRRDEHADQNLPHRFSNLDITEHHFNERAPARLTVVADRLRPTSCTQPRSTTMSHRAHRFYQSTDTAQVVHDDAPRSSLSWDRPDPTCRVCGAPADNMLRSCADCRRQHDADNARADRALRLT